MERRHWCRHTLLLLSVISFGLRLDPLSAQVPTSDTGQIRRNRPIIRDELHPAQFVTITEQTSAAKHYCVYTNSIANDTLCSAGHSSNNPSGEIDRRSRMIISFNREMILRTRQSANSDITISAFLSKSDGSNPPVEVPGYSVVGEQARIAPVRIRTGYELVAVLAEIGLVTREIQQRLGLIEIQTSAEYASSSADSAKLARIGQTIRHRRDSIAELESEYDARLRSYSDQVDSLVSIGDTIGVRRVQREANATLDGIERRMNQLVGAVQQDSTTAAELTNALKDSRALKDKVTKETTRRWRQALLDTRGVLETLLRKILSSADSVTFNQAARVVNRDPDVLRQHASEILKNHYPDLESSGSDQPETIAHAIEEIRHDIDRLRQLGDSLKTRSRVAEDSLSRQLVSHLKDTYILIAETGAEPGDYITLVVSSKPSDSDLPRELRVRLLVRQFGLVQRTGDSFLFLRRLGTATVVPPGSTDTVPEPYNYIPTAGVTFGWTLHHRREWLGKIPATLIRWLEPGFGVNVSFPRFGTVIKTVSTGPQAQVTVEEIETSRFDLAIGAVATFFGGALQVTYGRNFTAPENKTYWGIGFSFIRAISEVRGGEQ